MAERMYSAKDALVSKLEGWRTAISRAFYDGFSSRQDLINDIRSALFPVVILLSLLTVREEIADAIGKLLLTLNAPNPSI